MTAGFRSKTIARSAAAVALAAMLHGGTPVRAQQGTPTAAPAPAPDYVIGPADVLTIVWWREKELSGEVQVRPDGKISLPLLNDVHAAGLTPGQLRERLIEQSRQFVEEPDVTVIVKAMHSRRVFITGEVDKPGPYELAGPTTVIQLIAMAGGLREYADTKNIVILRTDGGEQSSFRFNYKDVRSRKSLRQNIELRPGDTVIVP